MTTQDAINELQSVIDLIKQDGKDWLDERDIPILKRAIEALEAQRWIPTDKRLPADGSDVLTTIQIPRRQPRVRSGFFNSNLFMNDNGDVWNSTDIEVIAWKPLPEPYKEEDV